MVEVGALSLSLSLLISLSLLSLRSIALADVLLVELPEVHKSGQSSAMALTTIRLAA